ncbi:cbb3-type cytochrome oxidase assembly protein CcoS [Alcanivorax sp. JB21]|uniref:cbb3-type cytochrome oxidase assembly protein CcoS n=1 Tax=Alcanivorax limicola TaxID=2874102 RepID=UPI001CBD6FB3|nr:cbb3-type cytochrome oxidase assembly protein CcoS [Alcanivorax limicola]MBZ2187890.1 cbb3-type cytochrome oxidase assembly protein CcoS [Alcanivorax limicola]
MEIVILLIPLALVVLGLAIAAFFWAVSRDQFDDLDSPAWRVLFDDKTPPKPEKRDPHGAPADADPLTKEPPADE